MMIQTNQKIIAIIGASGAIGAALARAYSNEGATVYAFSRHPSLTHPGILSHPIDYDDDASIQSAARTASENGPLDRVIVATGMLHDDHTQPEKSLAMVSADAFHRIFHVNTVIPTLIAKHFVPILTNQRPAIFAALSARVGSISDNQLGGWYAYRASKSALNMVIKNMAIETRRRNKSAIIVGLHPGTVDSDLSKPFQRHVPKTALFTPNHAAEMLVKVLETITQPDTGRCFAWDGTEIHP